MDTDRSKLPSKQFQDFPELYNIKKKGACGPNAKNFISFNDTRSEAGEMVREVKALAAQLTGRA